MRMAIYTYRWLLSGGLLLSLLLFCVSCSSDEAEEVPRINIYVYAPDRPIATRGEVEPTADEAKVHSLRIWVFKSSNPDKSVASLSLNTEEELEALNENKSASYSLEVTDRSFAQNPEPVDVYVMANVTEGDNSTYYNSGSSLDDAFLNGGDYFKFTTTGKATSAVSSTGIPMTGVARGKKVIDNHSVLHVNDANLKLVRAVSKIRFVFAALKDMPNMYVDGIKLGKNMLYKKEYYFLNDDHPNYWVEDVYDQEVEVAESDLTNPIKQIEDPTKYIFTSGMTDTQYENIINKGISDKELVELSTVYLPESDKRLSGTIYFRLSTDMKKQLSASFRMVSGDFRRNQTWIVYAYYIGSLKLEVTSVQVTDWTTGTDWEHEINNW